MFAIVTMQALHVYTDLDDRTRLKNANSSRLDPPKTGWVWLKHFNSNVCRGREHG